MEVYNAAWQRNWGFVPLTDAELDAYAKELRPILDEDFGLVAERDGEVVGVALSLPDYNQVLARLNGRLLPFGWLKAVRARSRIDEIRVFALGVKREYRHTGVAAGMYADVWRTCLRRKITRAETGWILETNEPMNRAMEALGGRRGEAVPGVRARVGGGWAGVGAAALWPINPAFWSSCDQNPGRLAKSPRGLARRRLLELCHLVVVLRPRSSTAHQNAALSATPR
jgi:GNAT superfamily N-acetyltransferase